jgi:hypothetical protein
LAIAWLTLSCRGAERTFVGAAACGKCHNEVLERQSASGHARALYPATEHPLSSEFFPKTPIERAPGFEFRFIRDPQRGFLMRVARGDAAVVMPIDWAFGAGEQAVTFVSKAGPDNYLEDYFSYYPGTHALGVTPGQERLTARDVGDAAGFAHRGLDIVSCFGCHSTGTVRVRDGTVAPTELGVRCEACHGPGSVHPERPRLSAVQMNELCGKCHRSPSSFEGKVDWEDPWNVRFQPAYLGRSACFLKSGGRLSCTTCHSVHDELRRDASFYNGVCSGCHPSAHKGVAERGDCVECHMPRVSPRAPLEFRNHWIAVYPRKNNAGAR